MHIEFEGLEICRCEQCNYTNSSKSYLALHMSLRLEEGSCKQSNYTCSWKSYLATYECKRLEELEDSCEQCNKESSCKSYLAIHVNINNSIVLHISYSAKAIDSEDPNYTSYSLIRMNDQDSSDDSNQHANPEMVQISVRKEVGSENQCTLFNVMHVNFVFTPFWIWGTWDM